MIEFLSPDEQVEHDKLKRKVLLRDMTKQERLWSRSILTEKEANWFLEKETEGTMIKEQRIEGVGLLKGTIKLAKEVMMGDDNEAPMTEAQKVLAKMIPLSTPKELPKNLSENCTRVWEAFNVGRDYERLAGKKG